MNTAFIIYSDSEDGLSITMPWYGGILAQVGTLFLEFTKLAELTGDSEFFFKVINLF